MAPKRSRQGKEIVAFNDKSECNSPAPIRDGRVAFSRNIDGLLCPTPGVDNFVSFFKISKRTFNYVRSIVSEGMEYEAPKAIFIGGRPMSINDKIGISLKRLNSVDSNENIADLFGTDEQTINEVTFRFVKALKAKGLANTSWPSDMTLIKLGFKRIRGMPNCCGAIETTHLKISVSDSECDSKVWLDRANNNSMKLQVIVDSTMRFLDVFAGFPGCLTADKVLPCSQFYNLAQNGERLNGNEMDLSQGRQVREYVVGGSGFQLLPWLITPYREEQLTEEQKEFNNVHLATTMVAKRALKKLKEVWSVIDGSMWELDRDQLPSVVLACCILHNIQIAKEGDGVSDVSKMLADHDPGYPSEESAFADENAEIIRDRLRLYLARQDTS